MHRIGRCSQIVLLLCLMAATAACDEISDWFDSDRGGGGSSTVVLELTASPQPLQVGDGLDLQVRIFNAENVVSVPAHIRFDSDVLLYDPAGTVVGPFLQAAGNVSFLHSVNNVDANDLVVGIAVLSPGPGGGASGNGLLYTVRFQVIAPPPGGSTTLVPNRFHVFRPALDEVEDVLFPPLALTIN